MMKWLAALAGLTVILFAGAPAHAADACATPGKFVFANVATQRAAIPPREHTTYAALGLRAKRNGCSLAIVCTPAVTGEDRYKIAGQRCAAVRQALARYERRPEFRRAIQDSIEKLPPKGLNFPAGSVVVILR